MFKHVIHVLLLFIGLSVFGQGDNHYKREALKANDQFELAHYGNALKHLIEIKDNLPEEVISPSEFNFKIGFCYYKSDSAKLKAIPFFEKHLESGEVIPEVHEFIAELYHLNEQFDKAIEHYKTFRNFVENDRHTNSKDIEKALVAIDRKIQSCNYGAFLVEHPIKAIIENLGSDVNTPYNEYAPVIYPDESFIALTRRAPGNHGGKKAPDGDYYEDIYIAKMVEGSLLTPHQLSSEHHQYHSLLAKFRFAVPHSISPNINSENHDAAIEFSHDGKKLFLYHQQHVWVSDRVDTGWSKPHKLEGLQGIINGGNFESSITFNTTEDVVYFSSERNGGYGGLDLYSAKKVNGVWTEPVNMGPQINTPYNEDSPYIDPDNKTLYFSSEGHSSMGGYDIFKTKMERDGWIPPVNLGHPVNTAGNDIFFSMTAKYNRGYYSSDAPGGKGKMDIYRVTFAEERPNFAEIKGVVFTGENPKPSHSKITVLEDATDLQLYNIASDSLTGEYLLLLGHGKKYKIKVETEGYDTYVEKFEIPDQKEFYHFYQEIHHIYLFDKSGKRIGQKVVLNHLPYDENGLVLEGDTIDMSKSFGSHVTKFKTEHHFSPDSVPNALQSVEYKFYITEDSLKRTLELQPDLNLNIPSETLVSFKSQKTTVEESSTTNSNSEQYYTIPAVSEVFKPRPSKVLVTESSKVPDLNKTLTPKLEKSTLDKTITLPQIVVLFDFAKDSLNTETQQKLNVMAEFLQQYPKLKVELQGHTDAMGAESVNLKLSRKRALQVKKFLEEKGIKSSRLKVKGYGESEPLAPNQKPDGTDDAEGRKLNRRVEFKLLVN